MKGDHACILGLGVWGGFNVGVAVCTSEWGFTRVDARRTLRMWRIDIREQKKRPTVVTAPTLKIATSDPP